MNETKVCSKCYERKPLTDFYMDSRNKLRTQPRCKECQKKMSREWWAANGKQSYRNHKQQQLDWRRDNPERYAMRQRRYHLKRKYAMSIADFQARVLAQGGKCAACGTAAELVIDHCHARSKVRELLCQSCNKGLGCFFDDPTKLRLAAEYLERHTVEE